MARFDPNGDGLNESQPPGSIPDFDDDEDLEYDVLRDEFADPADPVNRTAESDELDPVEFAEDAAS